MEILSRNSNHLNNETVALVIYVGMKIATLRGKKQTPPPPKKTHKNKQKSLPTGTFMLFFLQ